MFRISILESRILYHMFKKLALPLILLVALVMRLWNYTAIALWHDEAFSALLIRMPFDEMMRRIALDVHPPFYYWLLRVWSEMFGTSLGSLRGFSVFFGAATVLMLYVFVRELLKFSNKDIPTSDVGIWTALGASALLAVNPFHLQYSLEARMYTLGTFLVLLGSWVMLKALKTNRWKWWVFFALVTTASALTHYFMLFSLAAQGLFILLHWLKKFRPLFKLSNLKWLLSYVIVIVLYLPWLPTFWRQFTQVQENYWIPKMDIWSVPSTLWKILLGGWQGAPESLLILSTVFVIVIVIVYLWKYKTLEYWGIILLGIVPFVLAVLVSIKTALFLDRYFIFAAVFIIALVAMVFSGIKRRGIGISLLVLLMIASLVSYQNGWRKLDVDKRPGITAAAAYLGEQARPADEIVVSSTFIYFSHRYYYLELGQYKKFPQPKLFLSGISQVSQLPHFSGTALLEDDDFVGDLKNFAEKGGAVWLLWTTGFGGSKPEVPVNWNQLNEQKFPDVFPHRGDIFVTKYQAR